MKKFMCSVTVAILILVICVPFSALADMGVPSITSYNVHVGIDGLNATYYEYDSNGNQNQKNIFLPFGSKVTVYDKFSDTDWGIKFNYNGVSSSATVSDTELQKMFQEKETFPTKHAQQYSKTTGKINDKKGLNVRCGPAVGFDRVFGVRYNESVTLNYIYVDNTVSSLNRWAYITYNGKSGWACMDYITETATVSSATPSSTTPVKPSSPESLPSYSSDVVSFSQPNTDTVPPVKAVSSFFQTHTFLILVICFCVAMFLAGAAGVTIVLIMQAKKKKHPYNGNVQTQYGNTYNNYPNNNYSPQNNNYPPENNTNDQH